MTTPQRQGSTRHDELHRAKKMHFREHIATHEFYARNPQNWTKKTQVRGVKSADHPPARIRSKDATGMNVTLFNLGPLILP
jgi:hypothetical protein